MASIRMPWAFRRATISAAAGADGVMLAGCHPGECHYIDGNHRTAKRIPVLRKALSYVGINPDRLRLDWVSSAESKRFQEVVTEFTETVRALGPSELRRSPATEKVPQTEVAA